MVNITKTEESLNVLRDYVNNPWVKQRLLPNEALWNQLCSSMDVIEDCSQAISIYNSSDFSSSVGAKYLAVYGILQILYVQQDAIKSLGESLGFQINLKKHKEIWNIRCMRNCSVGHPSKSFENSYHFISRPTLSGKGFQLMSCTPGRGIIFRNVSIPEFAKQQEEWVIQIMREIIKVEKDKYCTHKRKFQKQKITSIFPKTTDWHLSKICESVYADPKIGIIHLSIIVDIVSKFKMALDERGCGLDDAVYENISYPIKHLKIFLACKNKMKATQIEPKAAEIFAWYLHAQIQDLRDTHAREIDEEYSR